MIPFCLTILLTNFSLTMSETDFTSLQQQLELDRNNPEILLKLGIGHHHLSADGDEKAIEVSEGYLTRVLAIDKNNEVAKAYLGSLITLKGDFAVMFWQKLKLAKKGIALIDEAITSSPENLEIRLVRGLNGLRLPQFMDRLGISIGDFRHIQEDDDFAKWSAEDQALVAYNLGLALLLSDKEPEAEDSFHQAAAVAPQSRWGKLAQEKRAQR